MNLVQEMGLQSLFYYDIMGLQSLFSSDIMGLQSNIRRGSHVRRTHEVKPPFSKN